MRFSFKGCWATREAQVFAWMKTPYAPLIQSATTYLPVTLKTLGSILALILPIQGVWQVQFDSARSVMWVFVTALSFLPIKKEFFGQYNSYIIVKTTWSWWSSSADVLKMLPITVKTLSLNSASWFRRGDIEPHRPALAQQRIAIKHSKNTWLVGTWDRWMCNPLWRRLVLVRRQF